MFCQSRWFLHCNTAMKVEDLQGLSEEKVMPLNYGAKDNCYKSLGPQEQIT